MNTKSRREASRSSFASHSTIVRQAQFQARSQLRWERFSLMLVGLEAPGKTKNGALGADDDFVEQYRLLCRDFAIASERGYSALLVDYLNDLVSRGHNILYVKRAGFGTAVVRYLVETFPQTVRQEWRLVLVAAVCLFGPVIAMMIAVYTEPMAVYYVLDSASVYQFEEMYDPSNEAMGRERDAGSDFVMFGFYIFNNTSIGFRCFATGLLLGIGPILSLAYNGLYMGAVFGHLGANGFGESLFPFVIGHGSFELTAIVLSGAAGLRLSMALIAPGRYRRRDALVLAGHTAMRVMFGVFVMFLIAAFFEAFWSSRAEVASSIKYAVGTFLWLVVFSYFLFSGRSKMEQRVSPERAPQ